MNLKSLHLFLTYQCTLTCDHCFLFGSPFQEGKMNLHTVKTILEQAKQAGTIDTIIFEGGEPFLCYPVLVAAVQASHDQGFQTGIVTNGYWAYSVAAAIEKLRPMAGQLANLTISQDDYHFSRQFTGHAQNALAAATELGIPFEVIEIAPPEATGAQTVTGQIPAGTSAVMYRGRAAEKLASEAAWQPWEQFSTCPYENLADPARVHIDPYGNIHLCEGIILGNIFEAPVQAIFAAYDSHAHPIVGPIQRGGPAGLCGEYKLPHGQEYADACHLCYTARRELRSRFPQALGPDQMYGDVKQNSVKSRRVGISPAAPRPAPVVASSTRWPAQPA